MDDIIAINKAEVYLSKNEISFVRPGKISFINSNEIEVVFLVPEALDESVAVIDPPDVRVNINLSSGEISLVMQM